MTKPSICECCQQAVPSPSPVPPAVSPGPAQMVCPQCGSLEIECLDWVRVNDSYYIGGNESIPENEYWCPDCGAHEKPVEAQHYCVDHGHRGVPCAVGLRRRGRRGCPELVLSSVAT